MDGSADTGGYLVQAGKERDADGVEQVVARHPSLPGCRGRGDTLKQALLDLADHRRRMLAKCRENGWVIPPHDAVPEVLLEECLLKEVAP